MRIIRKKLYFTGFISLLLLFPVLLFYLNNLEILKQKYCIVFSLYEDPPEGATICIGGQIPSFTVDIYNKINNKLDLSELNRLNDKLIAGEIKFNTLVLKLSEFRSYGDLISVLNVFMANKPYITYIKEDNVLVINTRGKHDNFEDYYKDGIYIKYKDDLFHKSTSLWGNILFEIKRFYSTILLNTTTMFMFFCWVLLSFFSLLNLKKFIVNNFK